MKLSSPIFVILSLVLTLHSNPLWANCQQEVDAVSLQKVALTQLRSTVDSKDAIAILPFFDISTTLKDPLLAESMPFAFYDLLATNADTVLHPYLSMSAWSSLNLGENFLAEQSTASTVADTLKARFVIYGSVQRTEDEHMRFFISIYDAKIKENIGPVFQFSTELNDFFFTQLRMGMDAFIKPLSLQRKDLANDDKIPKLQAFRYYAKGMGYAQTYDENALSMAVVWFEKALKESYYDYPDAAREMARSHYMLALLYRLTGRNPSLNWLEAQRHAHNFAKINSKDPRPKDKFTARFIHNIEHFSNGVTFYRAGQMAKAAKEASAGLADVPEDGQMAWLLSLAGGKPSSHSAVGFVCFE